MGITVIPPRVVGGEINNAKSKVTKSSVRCSLGFSHGAFFRATKNAEKGRMKISDGDISGFDLRTNDKRRAKFKDDLLESLREWMCNNMYTRDSPLKNDTKWKRDKSGELNVSRS